jgi:hypothetical protein
MRRDSDHHIRECDATRSGEVTSSFFKRFMSDGRNRIYIRGVISRRKIPAL